jgi:hypothetical protein
MQLLDLDYTYQYARESALVDDAGGRQLSLSSTPLQGRDAQFFRGSIVHPKPTVDLLLAVAGVAQARFFTPPGMLAGILAKADPVITCTREQFRFESFSACCSAYARLDLLPSAVYGDRFESGTTNVDFNPPMRMALSRLRDGDTLNLAVGCDGVIVHHRGDALVERKVKLPSRWLRGFLEVQACQARMTPRFDLPGTEFRQFLRDIPRGIKGSVWLSASGRGLRISAVPGPAAVAAGGLARLRVFGPIARHADRVRVYASHDGGETAWEIDTPDSRFFLVLSADVWRGFSGEGKSLDTLARDPDAPALGAVRASLHWQERIDPAEIAAEAGIDRESVAHALAECAVSGLVGYDLAEGAYFHRELPFDLALVEKLQPRLKDARTLVAGDAVTFESRGDPIVAWVRSRNLEYRVVVDAESARCTCPWYAKHGDTRGPCKHALAVRIALNEAEGGNHE